MHYPNLAARVVQGDRRGWRIHAVDLTGTMKTTLCWVSGFYGTNDVRCAAGWHGIEYLKSRTELQAEALPLILPHPS